MVVEQRAEPRPDWREAPPLDPGTNVIEVHVSRLRKKIDEGAGAALIHTVRGAGDRLGLSD